MYKVLKYIHQNLKQPLHAGHVAQQFGYSKWYFCERFKAATGKTFVEYVRHYRLQLSALEILSGRKIVEVAMEYGYDSVGGFNKAFLKEFGCAPTEYKKQAVESQLYYEKRRISMYQLSDRCAALREEALNERRYMPKYLAQRWVYFTLGEAEARLRGESNAQIIASGVVRTLDSFTPVIIPGELVVGFNFGDGPEKDRLTLRDDEAGRKIVRDSLISSEDEKRYFELLKNPVPNPNAEVQVDLTQEERWAQEEWAAIGRCIDSNHTVLAYDKILKNGFEGMLREAEAWEMKNGPCAMYTAVKAICRSACQMGQKYADCAKQLLESGNADYNAADLQTIIGVCSRVPAKPASSFLEAVQALWFAHILNCWEDRINANSLGHLDQILYPYYQADIEKGVLTREQAFEILCCLWIKLYRDYDVQQSCLGGRDANGKSMVNDLSCLMLDVTEQLGFIRCLSVRYSADTDKAFLKRALEVTGHLQKGVPFYFNDDVMIPALVSKGIPFEDACQYTQIGCVETVIPGKSNPHAVTGITNLLKTVEYVLCNGRSMRYPHYAPGVQTGALDKFKTYEQFFAAVLAQMEKLLDLTCAQVVKYRRASSVNAPKPYKSLLTEGCLETGRDFNDAGAVYDYYQMMLCGIPNLADSLAAIKKFVYEEQKYSLTELKELLESDFADEAVRAEFIHKVPKYGNDIDEVDDIAADVMNRACDLLDAFSEKYGLSFHAQPFTFLWMIDHGVHCAASADGRRAGEPLAYSCSAMQGRDFSGMTALLNSIAKLPAKRAPGTTSAIVEADPKLFCDRNIGAMTDLLAAAGKKGLCNVQFNIVDADTLVDAKKHPEKYNNLAVRVSGFSQKFNLLSPELQDHIIGRTKHTCL